MTKEQIDELFAFTHKKGVRYYDLQVELVDHLAEQIEREMENDKGLGFDAALQKVYACFGIFGFAHVVQEKQNALLKKNRNMWAQELKCFFTFPKFIITITMFLAAFTVGNYLSPSMRYYVVMGSVVTFFVYQCYKLLKKRKPLSKKILLLEYTPVASLLGPVLMFEYFLFFRMGMQSSLVFSLTWVFSFIVQTGITRISDKVQQQAEKLYPEAFYLA